jgi:uncharacterized RDD family membrane protein YckC
MQLNPTGADDGSAVSDGVAVAGRPPLNVQRARPVAFPHMACSPALAPGTMVRPADLRAGSAGLHYASFSARAAAAVIDFFVLQAVSMFLDSIFCGSLLNHISAAAFLLATVGPTLLSGAFCLFYYMGMESSSWQATLGKRIAGIKVVDLNGERIGFGRSSKRNMAKSLSVLTLGIGYLMPLWDRRKQALHDKAARCLVVRSA